MGISIGIDLGTTNSAAAVNRDGKPEIVLNSLGERTTPSVLGLTPKGEELVGEIALDNGPRNAQNTITSNKRLMGLAPDHENVQKVEEHPTCQYQIEDVDNELRVLFGDEKMTPVQISARILEKVKQDAENRLGGDVTHAVITVPAYFSINQKMATRKAGELAGLRVKDLLTEPTAAAMAFGMDNRADELRNLLVYDLGGGTFDVTVLTVVDTMFAEMAITGNMWLGGDDFDRKIVEYIIHEVAAEYNIDESTLKEDARLIMQLKREAEQAKIRLGQMKETNIFVAGVVPLSDQGMPGDIDVDLTRSRFESMIKPYVEETRQLVHEALEEANMQKEDIHHVLVVGGSTPLPCIQQMLEDEFGADSIMRNIDPSHSVALGAGIASETIAGLVCPECGDANPEDAETCSECGQKLVAERTCPKCDAGNPPDAKVCEECGYEFAMSAIQKRLPKAVGVQVAGDNYAIVAPKGTPYPTPDPQVVTFRTARADNHQIIIPIYHATPEDFNPDDNDQRIADANILLEGQQVEADTPVDISVLVTEDGCLDITAIVKDGSGRQHAVYVDPTASRPTTDEEEEEEDEGADAGPSDIGDIPWTDQVKFWVMLSELALEKYAWGLSGDQQMNLRRYKDQAQNAIESGSRTEGERAATEIEQILNQIGVYINAEIILQLPDVEPGDRNKISSLLNEIISAAKQGNSVVVNQKIPELNAAVEKATPDAGEAAGADKKKGTILKAMS